MSSTVCKDHARKTPSGPEEFQQGPGVLALITGLYRFYGVSFTPNKVIRPPINRAFITKYCAPRQAQGEAPRQPGDSQQLAADSSPPPLESTSTHLQGLEHCLRYMVDQQAPNHRDRYEQVLGLWFTILRPTQDVKEALLGGNLELAMKKLPAKKSRKGTIEKDCNVAPQANTGFDKHWF